MVAAKNTVNGSNYFKNVAVRNNRGFRVNYSSVNNLAQICNILHGNALGLINLCVVKSVQHHW